MFIKAKTITGLIMDVEVLQNSKVENLKEQLSKICHISKEDQKLIFSNKILNNSEILQNYGIQEGDIIVVLPIRRQSIKKVDSLPAPNKDLILQHTGGKDLIDSSKKESSSFVTGFSQLRNQLSSIMNSFRFPMQERTTNTLTIDPISLEQLKNMGFEESRAKRALILCRMNPQLAMEWLLEHENDDDIDESIPEETISTQEANFTPNAEAVMKLKEMGFSDTDINLALKLTNNDQEAACSWLLGDRENDSDSLSVEDASVIQAILTNPVIQSGLANPRVLQALKMLIENPSSNYQFMNDPEIAPVLLQVSDILRNQ